MRIFIASLLLLCAGLWAGRAGAVPPPLPVSPSMSIDLPADHIDITTGFSGTHVTLFGVRRHAGDVVVVLRGPRADIVVRRKGRMAGIWMNRSAMTFENIPVYYDYAISRTEGGLVEDGVLPGFKIGPTYMEYRHTGREDPAQVGYFREALVRSMQAGGHYPLEPKRILFRDDHFFRADFSLPADVPVGVYTIYTYLFDDGVLIDEKRMPLRVAQIGFNARLYDFAHQHGLPYGLLAVFIALITGWGAFVMLRRD